MLRTLNICTQCLLLCLIPLVLSGSRNPCGYGSTAQRCHQYVRCRAQEVLSEVQISTCRRAAFCCQPVLARSYSAPYRPNRRFVPNAQRSDVYSNRKQPFNAPSAGGFDRFPASPQPAGSAPRPSKRFTPPNLERGNKRRRFAQPAPVLSDSSVRGALRRRVLPPDCGRPNDSAGLVERSFTGERDAERERWPWMLLLGLRRNTGGDDDDDDDDDAVEPEWVCGAVLITRRYAVTAAHCVAGQPAAQIVLRIGEYDLTRRDRTERDVRVGVVTLHPQFRQRQNDIALLRLSASGVVTDRVRPVCLPPAGAPPPPTTQPVWVAGWGGAEFGGFLSDVLMEAQLNLVSADDCEASYRALPDFERSFPGGFNGTKLCAADPLRSGADACMGDSGGPLEALRADGRYEVVGLVSVGVGCGNPQFPGVYTRLESYVDWLVRNIADAQNFIDDD